jgi:predicted DNA-binding transcriptional regulator AlpA
MTTIYNHTQPVSQASDYHLLSVRDAAHELGICVSLFWRLVKTDDLPRPIYVTKKAPRWRRSELHAAIDARRAGGSAKNKRGATL